MDGQFARTTGPWVQPKHPVEAADSIMSHEPAADMWFECFDGIVRGLVEQTESRQHIHVTTVHDNVKENICRGAKWLQPRYCHFGSFRVDDLDSSSH